MSAQSGIAIVGMSCRLPGSPTLSDFWTNTIAGVDAVGPMTDERRQFSSFSEPPTGGFLEGIENFDAELFHITPREAEAMDPQQRLLLQETWRSLENASIDPKTLAGSRTAVIVGISHSEYASVISDEADPYLGTGNALSIAANRISYTFDLQGPSLAVDTACSSSLVAVHLACQSLNTKEADLAIALGSNLILSDQVDRHLRAGGFFAKDGRCKSFDHRADGYVRSEGVAAIVLKPLRQALADKDRIYATVLGSAQKNDGSTNGLTAPNKKCQVQVIRDACLRAEVDPEHIQYVETHGTGTKLGDPIETAALSEALERNEHCDPLYLGALKSQIGHLEAAAGIASLIRGALALHHQIIPPNRNFERVNPLIDLKGANLKIPVQSVPWPECDEPGVAVSSFGFGGTNAHVILGVGAAGKEPKEERLFQERCFWKAATRPLLKERRSDGAWSVRLDTPTLKLFQEHRFEENAIFPATALIEIAQTTARQLNFCGIESLEFLRPIALRDGLEIEITYEQNTGTLKARSENEPWVDCFCWKGLKDGAHSVEAFSLPKGPSDFSAESFYPAIENSGLSFGKSFRRVEEVWRFRGELVSKVSVKGSALLSDDVMNALLMDSCAQLPLLFRRYQKLIPTKAGKVVEKERLHENRELWVRARKSDRSGGVICTLDIFNENGTPIAQVEDLFFEAIGENQVAYKHRWIQKPTTSAPLEGSWIVLKDQNGLAEQLATKLPKTTPMIAFAPHWPEKLKEALDTNPNSEILHLWSLDSPKDSAQTVISEKLGRDHSLLRILQDHPAARLTCVTRGSQPIDHTFGLNAVSSSSLWGMGRTVWQENPERLRQLIDLDPQRPPRESDQLFQALCEQKPEPQIGFRKGMRFVPRLQRISTASSSAKAVTSVLITGGLGALGLTVAESLVKSGTKKVVLLGRRSIPDRSHWKSLAETDPLKPLVQGIENLESMGATIFCESIDIANATALRDCADRHQFDGVYHLAGVLQDSVLGKLKPEMIDAVFQAKVQGAWNLHEIFQSSTLKEFVLFSSIASTLGSASQASYSAANASLDTLAQLRRSQNLPGLSINWGPWREMGLAKERATTDRLARFGIDGFSETEGAELFEEFRGSSGQRIVAQIDWKKFTKFRTPLSTTLLSDLSSEQKLDLSQQTLKEYFSLENAQQRKSFLAKNLAQLIGAASGISVENFDPKTSLMEIGIDSLMGIELQVQIEERFGMKLTMEDLFKARDFETLIEIVDERLQKRPNTHSTPQESEFLEWNEGASHELFCFHPGALPIDCYASLAEASPDIHFRVAQIGKIEEGVIGTDESQSVAELTDLARSILKSKQPQGPYRLGGWSLGGVVAHELAAQLSQEGDVVEKLVLFDCPSPEMGPENCSISEEEKILAFGRYLAARQGKEIHGATTLDKLFPLVKEASLLPQEADEKLFHSLYEIYQRGLVSSVAKVAAHTHKTIKTDTLFVRASKNLETVSDGFRDGLPGWNARVDGVFTSSDIPTDHYNLFHANYAKELGAAVSSHLEVSR